MITSEQIITLSGKASTAEHLAYALVLAIEGTEIGDNEKSHLRALAEHVAERVEQLGDDLDNLLPDCKAADAA